MPTTVKTAGQDHETTYTRPYKYLSNSILFNLLLKMFKEETFTISLASEFQQLVFELRDFEGSQYEEVDYFSTLCALCLSVHKWEWTKEYWYIYIECYLEYH